MPRQSRIDIPGLLQHVIVRGIERTDIFRDDDDRSNFTERLSRLLVETGTECYAWALIPNHFHLLLKTSDGGLSRFMRRLLTGHAVYFNRRHNRSGHLFQNRYKSIVCDEDAYLLELVRYIHLNPLRAGLVADLDELGRTPWCGHGALIGGVPLKGQSVDGVLYFFSQRRKVAISHYQQFVADGLDMGGRPDLVGRDQQVLQSNDEAEDDEIFDPRILGNSQFADSLSDEVIQLRGSSKKMTLQELQRHVAGYFDLPPEVLKRRGRQNVVSEARALLCYLACVELRMSGTCVAMFLGVGVSSVSRALRRGEALYLGDDSVRCWWDGLLEQ